MCWWWRAGSRWPAGHPSSLFPDLLKGRRHVVPLRHRLIVGKDDRVDRGRLRGEHRLEGVGWPPSWVHEFVGVDVQQPVDAVPLCQRDAHLHVERLQHKQLVVARFVEKGGEPGFVPHPGRRVPRLEVSVARDDQDAGQGAQAGGDGGGGGHAVDKQVERGDAQRAVVVVPQLDLVVRLGGGRDEGQLWRRGGEEGVGSAARSRRSLSPPPSLSSPTFGPSGSANEPGFQSSPGAQSSGTAALRAV